VRKRQKSTRRKTRLHHSINAALAVSMAIGILFSRLTAAQGSASDAVDALVQVAKELRPKYGAIRFHREEQLEDNIDSGRRDSDSMPRVYRIEATPFDNSGPTTTVRVPNGLPTMYVATSGDGRIVYRLTGFQDPQSNFNQLVKDSQLPYSPSEQGAEARGLFCAEAVYGISPNWWVDGASSVKLKAAQHFFDSGHEDGLVLGAKWWKSAKGNRAPLNISTTRSGADFLVRVPVFWAPVEGSASPEVKLYSITVTETGACLMPSVPIVILK
jgi:hypothetical protein